MNVRTFGRCLAAVRVEAAVAAAVLAAAGCTALPKDPEKTLERVQQRHVLRVGLVESPPWVLRASGGPGGDPGGAEVQLVRQFAASLGATPEWIWGGEQEHLQALERYQLDLVVGGLDASTPWQKKIGVTRPYFVEKIVVGFPKHSGVPGSLNGVKVAVENGDISGAFLAKKHAIPVQVGTVSKVTGPIAGPVWRLERIGFKPTGFDLFERKHVMAVPPGENAILKRLGDFLQSQKSSVTPLLQASEPQP